VDALLPLAKGVAGQIDDPDDGTLTGKARDIAHRSEGDFGGVSQVGQISVGPVLAISCAELVGMVVVLVPVEDSGDRTLAGKVRDIAHPPTGGGRGIGQGSQINI
jgi:hypothetical protein